MKFFVMTVTVVMLSLSASSVSFADDYNGVTFGDYPTWADEAFDPQGR